MIRLGYTIKGHKPVDLTLDERRQGTYIIGTTGTGKSTLLKNIICQDMLQDRTHGLCVLDPHGDLVDDLLELVPADREQDVILFDPTDIEHPFGLNLLACDRDDPNQVRWVVSSIIGTLQRLFSFTWGPRLEYILHHALLTILTLRDSTFIELLLLLINNDYRQQIVSDLKDPLLIQFWDAFPEGERLQYELVSSTLNKISPFITDQSMRNIIGQPQNTLDLEEIMNQGKILFVNLSKGDLGEGNSSLLGSVLVNLILMSALKRRSIPRDQRRPFHLIVDEFQNFANESFAILQSEARKFAVDVVAAHQFRDQLPDQLKGSTLNVGNLVIFRVNGRDGYAMASQFDNTPPKPDTRVEPVYQEFNYQGVDFLIEAALNTGEGKLYQETELPRRPYSDMEAEMANLLSISPNYEAWCHLIYDPRSRKESGKPKLVEYHIETEEWGTNRRDKAIAERIRERSRSLARSKDEVEKEIARRSFGEIPPEEDLTFEKIDEE